MAWAYDNQNRLLMQTDAEGYRYTYTYDTLGNPLAITEPMGNGQQIPICVPHEVVQLYQYGNGVRATLTHVGQNFVLDELLSLDG